MGTGVGAGKVINSDDSAVGTLTRWWEFRTNVSRRLSDNRTCIRPHLKARTTISTMETEGSQKTHQMSEAVIQWEREP